MLAIGFDFNYDFDSAAGRFESITRGRTTHRSHLGFA